MTTRRIDPFALLARLDGDFDEIIRRTWGGMPPLGRINYVPATDVLKDGNDVLIRLELPGVDASDLDIEVHNRKLTISGERKESSQHDDKGIVVREMRYGSFRREFALPDGVSADNVSADVVNGILELRITGMIQPAPQPRKITVGTRTEDAPASVTGEEAPQLDAAGEDSGKNSAGS